MGFLETTSHASQERLFPNPGLDRKIAARGNVRRKQPRTRVCEDRRRSPTVRPNEVLAQPESEAAPTRTGGVILSPYTAIAYNARSDSNYPCFLVTNSRSCRSGKIFSLGSFTFPSPGGACKFFCRRQGKPVVNEISARRGARGRTGRRQRFAGHLENQAGRNERRAGTRTYESRPAVISASPLPRRAAEESLPPGR
jgi:hypothetical protein